MYVRVLLDRAIVFGRLRWAAMRHDLNIDFNAIRVPQFVDTETWTVDSDQLTHAVLKGDSPDDYDVLSRRIAELPSADPWRVAQGHDMIQILRIGLKHVLGTIPTSTGIKDITRVLRASHIAGGVPNDGLVRGNTHVGTHERVSGIS